MNRISKAILFGLVVLGALAACALIGVNLYIQSPGVQARLQGEAQKALGLPLQITSVAVTPWSGLHVAGLTSPGSEGTRMEAKSFDADYRLFPLLQGRLILGSVVLESPRLVWQRSQDGWRLPGLPELKTKSSGGAAKVATEKLPKFTVEKVEVRHGSIELTDQEGKRVAFADEVHLAYRVRSDGGLEGDFSAAEINWHGALSFTRVRSGLSYADGAVNFANLTGALAGGEVRGGIAVQTKGREAPFTLSADFAKIDLAKASIEAGSVEAPCTGLLDGKIELSGDAREWGETTGNGRVTLGHGSFRQLQFFQSLGQLLQIPELSDLNLSNGAANFRVANGHVYIEELVLQASDLRFATKGNVRFDGRLSLDARLSASKRLMAELPTFVVNNFSAPDAQGERGIAFNIGGYLEKPKTNLGDRVFKREVDSQVDSLLSSIFPKDDGKRKKEKDKKREAPKANAPGGDATAPAVRAQTPAPASPSPEP